MKQLNTAMLALYNKIKVVISIKDRYTACKIQDSGNEANACRESKHDYIMYSQPEFASIILKTVAECIFFSIENIADAAGKFKHNILQLRNTCQIQITYY